MMTNDQELEMRANAGVEIEDETLCAECGNCRDECTCSQFTLPEKDENL